MGGITPSCVRNASWSKFAQRSEILPLSMRSMMNQVIVISLPVAGMPSKAPVCTPRNVPRMATLVRLSLSLLGAFQAALEGEPVTGFRSTKVRALLAYLATESDRPHRRETLAALFWPEQPERVARSNLRYALSNLRKAIGDRHTDPPRLLVTRETVQFDCASDCWLDVQAFRTMIEADPADPSASRLLDQALSLYRGDFLEGFSVRGSPAFDDWALLVRERLHRQASTALQRLVEESESRGNYDRACEYAWRWVELAPWQEEAHQQLMRALALSGQRTAALAQYRVCRETLQREFGVEPSDGTVWLYEQIRDGTLAPVSPPAGLRDIGVRQPAGPYAIEPGESSQPVFVARERELARLDEHLRLALEGHGRTLFVTGEVGQGKSALVHAFARGAQDTYTELVVCSGYCNAYTGIGDPYLPFREILEMLTGDLDTKVAAGAIGDEHARRLQRALPLTAQALLRDGPDLIDVFVPGAALLRRAVACATREVGWVSELQKLVERRSSDPGTGGVQQDDLFEQYTTLLKVLARQVPLLLVLDDLQWADLGSISLLFHLGRRLEGSPILVVGAYRSEEVALGRDGERHPLEPVVNELKRSWGDIEIDLGQSEGRHFVPALLDSEPNRLDAGFRHMLYQQTRGHPLFTVELLRGMQERGDLIQDPEGYWVEGPKLNWEILPARVEAVIAERIDRLAEPLKEIVRAASVEGEVFTAEVVAQTLTVDEREIVASLSGELDRKHRLVSAQGIERVAAQRLSRYRFRHILFQKYVYNSLDQVERARLHEQVGNALETLHGARTDERAGIVPQLAWHFERAGMPARAVEFLQQAGDRAVRMSANKEAIVHLRKGLDLIPLLPDTPERARRELALLLAMVVPTIATQSWAAPELGQVYARARELGQQVGHTPRTLQAMLLERTFYTAQGEHRTGLALAEQFYELALQLEDPLYVMLGHIELGVPLVFMGHLRRSLAQLEQVLALYEPQLHRSLAFVYGQDPKVLALSFATYDLWFLGYPDQALEKGQGALALAAELDHPFSWVWAVAFAARVHRRRREIQIVQQFSEKQAMLWAEHGIPLAGAESLMNGGWVLFENGQHQEGIAQFSRGLDLYQSTGMALHQPEFLALFAKMCGEAGQPEKAARLLDRAREVMHQTDERYYEAELYRLEGELLLAQDPSGAPEAENSFHQAIDIARRQSAKMCELRATVSLCRLWLAQEGAGKRQEAHEMLSAVYGWFTEGFDTPDLQEAKALLEALA